MVRIYLSELITSVKNNKLFSLFVLLSLIAAITFHMLLLSTVPAGLSHDEVTYALSTEHAGADVSGAKFPLALFKTESEGNMSILPSLIIAPLHILMPLNQFSARLPYVFVTFLSALALYFLAKNLFHNKEIAFLVSIVFLFNPWTMLLTRFATDVIFALCFFLWGVASLLRYKGKWLIVPFLFFLFGFYSYHGAKAIFLPIIVVILFYRVYWDKNLLPKREALLFFFASCLIFVSFFTLTYLIPGSILHSRGGQIAILNKAYLQQLVDVSRKTAVQLPFKLIFINKFTVGFDVFLSHYLMIFSPQLLFLHGDLAIVLSYVHHGFFYITDMIFILWGLATLFMKKRRVFYLLFSLLLVAPIPSAISTGYSYTSRSFFLLPIMVIFIGVGIYTMYKYIQRRIPRIFSFILIGFMVIAPIVSFAYFYFSQYSLLSSQYSGIGEKVLSTFLERNPEQPTIVISTDPESSYLEYAFFTNTKSLGQFIHHFSLAKKRIYSLENVSFISTCPKIFHNDTTYILGQGISCPKLVSNPTYAIKNPTDAGTLFTIYHNSFCANYPQVPYLRYHYLSDFHLVTMSNEIFCERWMLQP